jgi:Spy/CpxP family protein refolding chaperone
VFFRGLVFNSTGSFAKQYSQEGDTKMSLKRITPFVLGAAMAMVPLVGAGELGEGEGHHGRGMRGHKMHKFGRMLDLTEQQKQALASARKAEMERTKAYRDQVKVARKQIHEDVLSGNFNEEKTRSLLAQNAQAETELALSRARMHAAFYNVLTPEQRTKLNELRQKREQRRQERKQKLEQQKGTTTQ